MRIDCPAQELIHSSALKALGLSKSDISKLTVIRGPVLEHIDSLLFLSKDKQPKLKIGESSISLQFDELTEYGLGLLMREVFEAYERKYHISFRNIYEALDAYHFSCLNYNKVLPEHNSVQIVLSSDNFWVDLSKMTSEQNVYLDDGLPHNYEYKEDSKYNLYDAEYFNSRCQDTLAGWTYTVHNNSFCLTPPICWHKVPKMINVNWYKRPLYWSLEHKGYFVSDSIKTLTKIRDLGALYDPND